MSSSAVQAQVRQFDRRPWSVFGSGVSRSRVRISTVGIAIALAITFAAPALQAKVFASQNQALREAFPEATRIDRDSRILLKDDLAKVIGITKNNDQPKLVVLHTAWNGDELLGHAHIDVHNVRTKPEAFLIVVTPEGVVRSVRILAFHEPLDYLPTDRWYGQFSGKTKADRLRVGGDVHGVVGATLSAQAAARGVRRMLAYWEVLLQMPDSTEAAKSPVLPMLPKSAGTAEPKLQEP